MYIKVQTIEIDTNLGNAKNYGRKSNKKFGLIVGQNQYCAVYSTINSSLVPRIHKY